MAVDDFGAATGFEQPVTVDSRPVITQQVVHIELHDERVQDVLGRMVRVIQLAYPDAEFLSYIGTNPLGVYLEVYTDDDAFDGILKILDDRFSNLHVAAGVNICVLPRQKVREQAA